MDEKDKTFALDLSTLRRRDKPTEDAMVRVADNVGKALGFEPRQSSGRSRPPSPRDGQVHARVLPHVAREIAEEAKLRGVQQGVLIEEAWALYCARRDGKTA